MTIVPDYSKEQLIPIIQRKILEGSTIHTDGWEAYDGLILNGYTHYRICYRENVQFQEELRQRVVPNYPQEEDKIFRRQR